MKTAPPDKQEMPETTSQVETLEEIAHKIVKRYLDDYINDHQLEQQILSALRNERERAARITDDILPIGADNCYWCERVKRAARLIREGK